MKWLFALLFVVSCNAFGQVNFQSLAERTAASLDNRGYLDVEFQWNMEGKVQAGLNEGLNYLAEGSPKLARPNLEDAVRLAPDLWVTQYYYGVCLKQLDEFSAAEKALTRANELQEKNFAINIELGKAYYLQRQYVKALRQYKKASNIAPRRALPHYLMGNVYAQLDDWKEVRKTYLYCLHLEPTFADARIKLALMEWNYRDALNYVEGVLKRDSLNRKALLYHGIWEADVHPKVALKDFDRLVRLSPTNMEFRLIRGIIATIIGDYDKAFSDIKKLLSELQIDEYRFTGTQSALDKGLDIQYAGFYVVSNVYGLPDEDAALVRKAYCLLLVERFDESLKVVGQVKNGKTSPLCLFIKGLAFEHKGEHKQAFVRYDSALKFDKDIFDAHKKRGIYLTEMKAWGAAEADFNQMIRINPQSVSPYRFRGIARYNSNNISGAIEDFSKYLSVDSSSQEVSKWRGISYKRINQYLASTLDMMKSGSTKPEVEFSVLSGELNRLLANKDTTKALWYLRQFLYISPRYIEAHISKIGILMMMKDWTGVENSVAAALSKDEDERSDPNYRLPYTDADLSFLMTARAMAFLHTGNVDTALKEFTKAIGMHSSNSLAYLGRGKTYARMNNKTEAVKDLQVAAQMGESEANEILKKL